MDSLPPELLARVFEYLAYDRPHVDIASSRLVSKRLHALSSPFLITTAVIANRVDTLQKLRELLDHPYFSKHVTRLVWDASCYSSYTAENLHNYEFRHQESYGQPSAIRTYRKSVLAEQAAKVALQQGAANPSRLVGQREYLLGELTEASYLVEMKWTNLAERLFGQTLSPDTLLDAHQGSNAKSASWTNLKDCLRNLVKINPQLKSLSFGRSKHSAWDTLHHSESPRMVLPDMHPDEEEHCRSLFGSVRHLSLPVEVGDHEGVLESSVVRTRKILSCSATSVTHLKLETELYSGLWRDTWAFMKTVALTFAKILGQIHFQSLESIVLRGWLIPLKDLEDLLLAHAKTLRKIHLINCCLEGASKNELATSIRSKLEPALALEGVEVYGLTYEVDCIMSITRDEYRADCHDIENLFLGGRRNVVTKVRLRRGDWFDREMWWDEGGAEEEEEGEEEEEDDFNYYREEQVPFHVFASHEDN